MKHLVVVSLISLAATPFGFAQTSTAADNKTFREFPPRQKPGSFSLDRLMEAVTKPQASGK